VGGPLIGVAIACVVAGVIFGGLPRVAAVAVAALPSMVAVYMLMTLYVISATSATCPG
jgi:AGCS family alanine or glycine:cation symporter